MKTNLLLVLLLVLLLAGGAGGQDLKLELNGSLRHPSQVQSIALTPDSQKAFVALNDGTLLAYALKTRKPIEVGFRAYAVLYGVAVNPKGNRLVLADGDGWVTVLDTDSLKVVTRRQFKDDPENVAFSPDGRALFVAFSTGRLGKLKASDLATEADILPTEGSRVLALACARDGKLVATTDRDGNIKLWSAAKLKLQKVWKAHKSMAWSLAFDRSGDHLVSGGMDGELKVWKLADYSLVRASKEYHQESIECIAFAPDGRMVTGGQDGLCQFWDGATFTGGKSFPNYRGFVKACAVSADGRWLVRGGSALDFVPLDRPEAFERVADYGGAILGFAVAPDPKRFATGGLDRRLICWKVDKGITSKSALLQDWITAVEFCNDGRSVAAGLANGKIELYSAETMQRARSWVAHKGRVTGMAVIGGTLISVGDDAAIRLWDLKGKLLKAYDEKAPCRSIAVRGNRFAVGTVKGTVSVYDTAADGAVKRLQVRPLSVTAIAFSRVGTRLLVGYFDGGLESYDTKSWAVVRYQAGRGDSILSISASPNNALIAVGTRGGNARLVEVLTLKEGPAVQPGPAREIFAIRWVLGENTFAIAGASNGIVFQNLKGDVEAWTKKIRSE
jgi:WD40 repeat protein